MVMTTEGWRYYLLRSDQRYHWTFIQ